VALRGRIRNGAARSMGQLEVQQKQIANWLEAHRQYGLWSPQIAGWRALFNQQQRDKNQHAALIKRRCPALSFIMPTFPAYRRCCPSGPG
jgi:exonuclease SbcC